MSPLFRYRIVPSLFTLHTNDKWGDNFSTICASTQRMLGGLITEHVLQQFFIVCRNSLYTLVMRRAWLHFISAATFRAVLFKAHSVNSASFCVGSGDTCSLRSSIIVITA